MKRFLSFLLLVFGVGGTLSAQTSQWVWVNGSDTFDSPGVFGTQGVPSVTNSPPALYESVQWKDKEGNFWIYGGVTSTVSTGQNEYGDLWKYDPVANTWTWVKGPGTINPPPVYGTMGVPSPLNTPGLRGYGCDSWTDSSGDLWLFGGWGIDTGSIYPYLDDLWRYNIASNEWTWMSGSTATSAPGNFGTLYQPSDTSLPTSRIESLTAWTDSTNNLWLFGGYTRLGNGNDLWRYNISTNQWAWMGGAVTSQPGSYGAFGIESAGNWPPSRWSYNHWMLGNYFYLSGGLATAYVLNDVWRYNLLTNQWAWVGGDEDAANTPVFGAYCSALDSSVPGGLYEQRSVQINGCNPRLMMWGGWLNVIDIYNDLWEFDLGTHSWTWLSGDSTTNAPGNFGTMGVSTAANMPPSLAGPCFWADTAGNFFVWGGWVFGRHQANTMWKYVPDPACFPASTGTTPINYTLSTTHLCTGDSAIITLSGASSFTISPSAGITWQDSVHAVLYPDSSTTYVISGHSPCGAVDTAAFTLNVLKVSVSISGNKTIICPTDSAQFCAPAGYSSYLWNTGATTNCITTSQAGNYYVTVSETGCSATSNHLGISVYPVSPVAIAHSGDTLKGYNSVTYQWYLNGTAIPGADNSIYIATEPGTYSLQVTDSNGCIAVSNPQIISGINDVEAENISVYPNPTNSTWQLNVAPQLIGSEAEVFDVTGKLVFKSQIINQQSTINIGAASGVYVLRVSGKAYSYCTKLVKL